jgi:GGDEF domain-containing protein
VGQLQAITWIARRLFGFGAFIVLLLPACAGAIDERTVLSLDRPDRIVALSDWGDAYVDPTGRATVETLSESPSIRWERTAESAVYGLPGSAVLWVRFTIPPAPDNERWYLEVASPSVDQVTLFTKDAAGIWHRQTAGDRLPVESWPVPHRHPLLPVDVSAEEPRRHFVRIENPRLYGTPLRFVSETYLARSEQRTALVQGIYFGLAAMVILLAAVCAAAWRDYALAYAGMSIFLMGLTQATLVGVAGLHIWPHFPRWTDLAFWVLPLFAAAATIWLYASIVSLRERAAGAHRWISAYCAAALPLAFLLANGQAEHRHFIMLPYLFGSTGIATGVVAWSVWRGDRYGSALLATSLPLVVGAAFPIARTLGLIPASFWTAYAIQLATAIEWPVLLVVLMLRGQSRRESRRRIRGLARLDPATGLINQEEFSHRLVQMNARSERLGYQSAVLVLEIVNIEQLCAKFDLRSADEMPLRVASRLLSTARDIDNVGRLSAYRFGVLVEGPLSDEEAASIGARVVARCLMPFKNKPLEWIPKVRVAQSLLPHSRGLPVEHVLIQLIALLKATPRDSKRSVFRLPKQDAEHFVSTLSEATPSARP